MDEKRCDQCGGTWAEKWGVIFHEFSCPEYPAPRGGFKRWFTRYVPAAVERSTYVLASAIALIVLYWQWRPMPGVVWSVTHPAGRAALTALCAAGWAFMVASTFMINHFDLFGLRISQGGLTPRTPAIATSWLLRGAVSPDSQSATVSAPTPSRAPSVARSMSAATRAASILAPTSPSRFPGAAPVPASPP